MHDFTVTYSCYFWKCRNFETVSHVVSTLSDLNLAGQKYHFCADDNDDKEAWIKALHDSARVTVSTAFTVKSTCVIQVLVNARHGRVTHVLSRFQRPRATRKTPWIVWTVLVPTKLRLWEML